MLHHYLKSLNASEPELVVEIGQHSLDSIANEELEPSLTLADFDAVCGDVLLKRATSQCSSMLELGQKLNAINWQLKRAIDCGAV